VLVVVETGGIGCGNGGVADGGYDATGGVLAVCLWIPGQWIARNPAILS
jgi:hypothetical protein